METKYNNLFRCVSWCACHARIYALHSLTYWLETGWEESFEYYTVAEWSVAWPQIYCLLYADAWAM